MKKLLILCLCLSHGISTFAQKEKIKGNKIVMTDEKVVEAFHSIDLQDEFEVTIQEDNDNIVKIEADSNLQEFVDVEVRDSVLRIKARRDFRKAKAQNITILYGGELRSIRTYNKIQLTSKSPIKSPNFLISANDQSEVFLTVEGEQIEGKTNGKAEAELHFSGKEAIYQVNESSKLKSLATVENLNIDLYQKGAARVEGETKTLQIRADSGADFYGEKFRSKNTKLIVEGSSHCYVLADKDLSIEAIDKAEIYILGEPKIEIVKFLNEAILYKKKADFTVGKLKL